MDLRLFLLPLLLSSSFAPTAADDYTNETWGFRIRPPRGWTSKEQPADDGTSLQVHFLPPGSQGAVALRVEVQPTANETAEGLVREAVEGTAELDAYSDVEEIETRVADGHITGVAALYEAPGSGTFRIRRSFAVKDGLRFSLQRHAPADDFDRHVKDFERAMRTFRILAPDEATSTERRLAGLAARCGTEVDWVATWDEAARRARDEDRMVLVYVRYYQGFAIPDASASSTFMDPDILGLIDERFIALRLTKGDAAPFIDASVYGMGPSTFGTGILVTDPAGNVLHQTHAWRTSAAYQFLLEAVDRFPGYAGKPVAPDLSGAELAARRIRRGEIEVAEALVDGLEGAAAHRLRASLARLRRDGETALTEIAAARAAGADDPELDLVEAGLLLHLERAAEAEAIARRVLQSDDEVVASAATFVLAVCAWKAGDKDRANELWDHVMEDHPDQRWAWQAAATRQLLRLAPDSPMSTAWPPDDALAALRNPEPAPLEPAALPDATNDALAWLLEEQRDDGSWPHPLEIATNAFDGRPNPFVEAVTAIAGRALLAVGSAQARDAAERGLEHLVQSHRRGRALDDAPQSYMDYTPYADAWTIWFMADCIDAEVGDRRDLQKVIRQRAQHLQETKQSGGGWSYYITNDLAGEVTAADQSISFITALVTIALGRADDVGGRPPRRLRGGGLDCLERMRNANGTFTYMMFHGDESSNRRDALGGAGGRGPACALALFHGGRTRLDGVRAAVTIFTEQSPGLAAEAGKSVMHTGPEAQGSHYVMFDYAFAAAAIAELPAEERGPHATRLLEKILDLRSVEGGFRDTSLNGWSYGTAMALLAFGALSGV